MAQTLIVCLMLGLIIGGIVGYPAWVQWQRDRLKSRPFPALWQSTLEHVLPMYAYLSPEERRRLQEYIQVFLAEKQFIGCNGLQVTQEMKLTIASVACLLLLNQRECCFPKLRSILIYPKAYWVHITVAVGNGVVEERREARLGESWSTDQVVLSWEQIQQDMNCWQDGRNVILHEFAHQLDQEDGKAEGVPVLPTNADYDLWAKVMTEHYQQLCQDVRRGIRTVFDSYGAKDPAEFFAVATETFFEKPDLLKQRHPVLYARLQTYYCLDPSRLVQYGRGSTESYVFYQG
jgi:MtfA peptidase